MKNRRYRCKGVLLLEVNRDGTAEIAFVPEFQGRFFIQGGNYETVDRKSSKTDVFGLFCK